MSNSNVMKKISIQKTSDSKESRDIGLEAQNGSVSYDSNGDVIIDPSVTPTSTKSVAKAFKDINTDLDNKIEQEDFDKKADMDSTTGLVQESELPDQVINVVEGYYKKETGKFYSDNLYIQELQGKSERVYIDKPTNLLYYWNGSYFVKIIDSVNLNLEDLASVNISSLGDGDSLVYENGEWVNRMDTVHLVTPPRVDGTTTFTYNGQLQGPNIIISDPDFSNYVNVTRDPIATTSEDLTKGINAGTYTITYSLKNDQTSMWNDLTTASKDISFTINKKQSQINLDSTEVILDNNHLSATIPFTVEGDGIITVISSARNIAIPYISGNNIIIESTETSGNATITVSISDGDNYLATSASIAVTASFARLVSWSTGTDEEISKMVQAYYNGTFTLAQVQSVWHVGDEREISLSAIAASQSGIDGWTVDESHRAQTVKMVILDFDHDTLTTSTGGKTKALVTLGQKDCLRDATVTDEQGSSNTERGYINSSSTNVGGWTSCARRAWCNNGYYNALPQYLHDLVKPVNKLTSEGNLSTRINTDSDKVFLLSEIEIYGTTDYSSKKEGTQYSYYTTASNRYKLPKRTSSDVSGYWWGRSPNLRSMTSFCFVDYDGDASIVGAATSYGLAPAFAM